MKCTHGLSIEEHGLTKSWVVIESARDAPARAQGARGRSMGRSLVVPVVLGDLAVGQAVPK